MAAAKTATGKSTAIDGTKVTIAIEGERPDWIKKNGPVKFKVGPGIVIELSAADAKPFTIVVTIKKAAEMKVGDAVTFEKGLASSGCWREQAPPAAATRPETVPRAPLGSAESWTSALMHVDGGDSGAQARRHSCVWPARPASARGTVPEKGDNAGRRNLAKWTGAVRRNGG